MKVLITPSSFGECGLEPFKLLEQNGIEYHINPKKRRLTSEEVLDLGRDCVGIIAGLETLDKNTLQQFSNLQVISRLGSGLDNVDVAAAEEKDIVVRSTPFGPTRAVAELTLGLVLSLLRNVVEADRNIRAGVWQKHIGQLLQGRKVGILGLGRIGREVAQLLILMGCEVIAYDLMPDLEWASRHNVEIVSWLDLMSDSEILCIHISSSSDKSVCIIGEDEFNMMHPDVLLINMSRGGVMDENALEIALQKGYVKGAALDVFQDEPYSGSLIEVDNVILTPHLGSYAKDAKLAMEIEAVKNLLESLGT